MSKEEWYYLEGRERKGPVSENEIRKRLVAELLKTTDMVWKEGMEGWTRLGETEEFGEGGKRASRGGGDDGFQIRADLGVPVVELFLEWAGKLFGGGFYRRCAKLFVNLGHLAILVSLVFVLLLGLSFTVKGEAGVWGIGTGILLVLGLLVAQYVASRFLRACQGAIDENPSKVTCRPVLDAMAALGLLGVVYFVAVGISALVSIGFGSVAGYQILAEFLLLGAISLSVACLGLNPGVANIEVIEGQRDAGDEALGLVAFFSKGFLVLAPVVFGFGALALTFSLGILVVGIQGDSNFDVRQSIHLEESRETVGLLFKVVLVPAFFYLLFLGGWLLIRVTSATLVLPGKVDRVVVALESASATTEGEESGEGDENDGGEKDDGGEDQGENGKAKSGDDEKS